MRLSWRAASPASILLSNSSASVFPQSSVSYTHAEGDIFDSAECNNKGKLLSVILMQGVLFERALIVAHIALKVKRQY